MLEIKEAKMLFDEGVLVSALIETNELLGGFGICLTKKNGEIDYIRTQRSSDIKRYREVDSAIKAVQSIGFRSVEIRNIQEIYF